MHVHVALLIITSHDRQNKTYYIIELQLTKRGGCIFLKDKIILYTNGVTELHTKFGYFTRNEIKCFPRVLCYQKPTYHHVSLRLHNHDKLSTVLQV